MKSVGKLKGLSLLVVVVLAIYVVVYTLLVSPRRFKQCLTAPLSFLIRNYKEEQKAPLPQPLPGNAIQLLVNGDEALPALLDLIDGAQQSIRWQVMLFFPDEAGRTMANALARAAQRGVRVQLSFNIEQTTNGTIADGYSREKKQRLNRQMKEMLAQLSSVGVEVLSNDPGAELPPDSLAPGPRQIQQNIYDHTCVSANHYDHRKLLVIDGKQAWMGGMNVGNEYLYRIPPVFDQDSTLEVQDRARRGLPEAWEKWFDTSVIFEGPVVAEIAAAFDWKWQVLGGKPLREVSAAEQLATGSAAVQFLNQQPGLRQAGAGFFALVESAEHEIYVASPFVSFGPALEALQAASRRGVRVVFVYPDAHQESAISGRMFHDLAGNLVDSGVELYFNDLRMAHTKLMVVDGKRVLLGSLNLNHRSFLHDLEIAAVVEDEVFASQVINRIFQPYLTISRPVPSSYKRPPWNPLNWWIRPFA